MRKAFDFEKWLRRITAAAERRGITMRQLAAETGVSETTLSRMKNHGRVPDGASLAVLSDWAGVNPAKCTKAAA